MERKTCNDCVHLFKNKNSACYCATDKRTKKKNKKKFKYIGLCFEKISKNN